METLFIWNRAFIQYLKANYNNISIVCSVTEKNNLDINTFKNIIILVELDWVDSSYYGYNLALDIIKEWKDDENPPNVIFYSYLSRIQLFKLNNNVNKFFAKSFEHALLPFTEKINLEKQFSSSKWLYLKKYALTTKGILDTIKHDIERELKKDLEDYSSLKLEFIQRLKEISNIIDDDIKTSIATKKTNHKEHLQEILLLTTNCIKNLNTINKQELNYTGYKEQILLLEDNIVFLNEISSHLEKYFKVDKYSNGEEAKEAIKINGLNYRAVILDLELLEKNTPLDQSTQGIEVYEFVKNNYRHIVRRILTGLPREGVKILLDINQNDVLQKSQLAYLGYDDGFANWIKDLKTEISKYQSFLFMDGPDIGPWGDKINKKEERIEGLKSFYHLLKVEQEQQFNIMWKKIKDDVSRVIGKDEEIKIPTQFVKTASINKLTTKKNNNDLINLLQLLITHRLIWLFYYENGDKVIYKDNSKKDTDMFHKYFWDNSTRKDNKFHYSPKKLFPLLGLSLRELGEQDLSEKANRITFTFSSCKIFKEEYEFLKENEAGGLTNDDVSDAFKEIVFNILTIINNKNGDFDREYPNPPTNFFEITRDIIDAVLNNLAGEDNRRNISASRRAISDYLIENMDNTPTHFKIITNSIIDNL